MEFDDDLLETFLEDDWSLNYEPDYSDQLLLGRENNDAGLSSSGDSKKHVRFEEYSTEVNNLFVSDNSEPRESNSQGPETQKQKLKEQKTKLEAVQKAGEEKALRLISAAKEKAHKETELFINKLGAVNDPLAGSIPCPFSHFHEVLVWCPRCRNTRKIGNYSPTKRKKRLEKFHAKRRARAARESNTSWGNCNQDDTKFENFPTPIAASPHSIPLTKKSTVPPSQNASTAPANLCGVGNMSLSQLQLQANAAANSAKQFGAHGINKASITPVSNAQAPNPKVQNQGGLSSMISSPLTPQQHLNIFFGATLKSEGVGSSMSRLAVPSSVLPTAGAQLSVRTGAGTGVAPHGSSQVTHQSMNLIQSLEVRVSQIAAQKGVTVQERAQVQQMISYIFLCKRGEQTSGRSVSTVIPLLAWRLEQMLVTTCKDKADYLMNTNTQTLQFRLKHLQDTIRDHLGGSNQRSSSADPPQPQSQPKSQEQLAAQQMMPPPPVPAKYRAVAPPSCPLACTSSGVADSQQLFSLLNLHLPMSGGNSFPSVPLASALSSQIAASTPAPAAPLPAQLQALGIGTSSGMALPPGGLNLSPQLLAGLPKPLLQSLTAAVNAQAQAQAIGALSAHHQQVGFGLAPQFQPVPVQQFPFDTGQTNRLPQVPLWQVGVGSLPPSLHGLQSIQPGMLGLMPVPEPKGFTRVELEEKQQPEDKEVKEAKEVEEKQLPMEILQRKAEPCIAPGKSAPTESLSTTQSPPLLPSHSAASSPRETPQTLPEAPPNPYLVGASQLPHGLPPSSVPQKFGRHFHPASPQQLQMPPVWQKGNSPVQIPIDEKGQNIQFMKSQSDYGTGVAKKGRKRPRSSGHPSRPPKIKQTYLKSGSKGHSDNRSGRKPKLCSIYCKNIASNLSPAYFTVQVSSSRMTTEGKVYYLIVTSSAIRSHMLERSFEGFLKISKKLKGVGFDSDFKMPSTAIPPNSNAFVNTLNQYLNQLFEEEGAAKNRDLRSFIGLDWLDGTRVATGPTCEKEILSESQQILLNALKVAVKANQVSKDDEVKLRQMIRSGHTKKISEGARLIQETIAKQLCKPR